MRWLPPGRIDPLASTILGKRARLARQLSNDDPAAHDAAEDGCPPKRTALLRSGGRFTLTNLRRLASCASRSSVSCSQSPEGIDWRDFTKSVKSTRNFTGMTGRQLNPLLVRDR
jgi:hypothetical protein